MDKDAGSSIGKRIQKARLIRGMSQTELAEALGVKPQAVQHWERGTAQPKSGRIKEIAKVLSVEASWLLYDEDPNSSGRSNLNISQDEELLLTQYRRMDTTRRQIFEDIAFVLTNDSDKPAQKTKPKKP